MSLHYRRRMTQTYCRNGAVFVHQPDCDTFVRLEGTGRRIWELLEYPITMEEISRSLVSEFSGVREKISGDTGLFLASLLERGLAETRNEAPSPFERQRSRYLGLIKRALVNLIYPEHELRIRFLEKPDGGMNDLEQKRYLRDIRYREPNLYQTTIDAKHDLGMSPQAPYRFSHTMIGLPALDNIERCAEIVFLENIPGDFMEAGVCQGGAAVFMRALQTAHGGGNRRLWVADSFEGLPLPESEPDVASGLDLSEAKAPSIAFCLRGVRDHFIRYDFLDEGVVFLPGWFAETLHDAPIGELALLRLDADLYASTRDALEHLYPKVAPGGFVIVDDYGHFAVCRQAVDEYRTRNGIYEPIQFVGRSCVYWRKRT